MPEHRIKTIEELEEICRDRGESKIVTTNGCYDLIHRGHITTFHRAKKYGDILIVGVNSDESVRRYKTTNRPVMNEWERAYVVASIKGVDYVTVFNEDTPIEMLERLKPNFHVKSKSGYKGTEKEVVEKHGGRIVLVNDIHGLSSGDLVRMAGKIYIKDELYKEI